MEREHLQTLDVSWGHERVAVESCARMSNEQCAMSNVQYPDLQIAHCSLAIEAHATVGSWKASTV